MSYRNDTVSLEFEDYDGEEYEYEIDKDIYLEEIKEWAYDGAADNEELYEYLLDYNSEKINEVDKNEFNELNKGNPSFETFIERFEAKRGYYPSDEEINGWYYYLKDKYPDDFLDYWKENFWKDFYE